MRQIRPEMVNFIHEKLKGNGLAQEAVAKKDAAMLLRLAAQACVGIREEGGANRGHHVQLIQDTVGDADAWAWCMSAVQTVVAYVEVILGVKSTLYPHEHVLTVWNKTPQSSRVYTHPQPGDIVIWQHGKTSSGHTEIIDMFTSDKTFLSFGGNTNVGVNDGGRMVREGDGFYYTKRSLNPAGNMHIVGFLRPFP